jgi:DNA-directed RNA polymerase specialized sigma subunit
MRGVGVQAWKALPLVERERQVLACLDDKSLTIKEVAAGLGETLGIAARYIDTELSTIMRRMVKAGRLERAVVKRNVHCYFHPRPLDGQIAELEHSYQSDAGTVA